MSSISVLNHFLGCPIKIDLQYITCPKIIHMAMAQDSCCHHIIITVIDYYCILLLTIGMTHNELILFASKSELIQVLPSTPGATCKKRNAWRGSVVWKCVRQHTWWVWFWLSLAASWVSLNHSESSIDIYIYIYMYIYNIRRCS